MQRLFLLLAGLIFTGVAGFGFAADREILVGTNAEFMPFEFTDEANNIIGFDIDIINAVAGTQGLKVKMHNQSFDTLIEGLETGKINAAISGMTITEARKQKVDFSEPYYNAAQVIVVRDNTPGFTKIEDIVGKKIGVQLGTTGALMAEQAMGETNPDLKQLRKYNMVFSELKLGRIEAVVVDKPVAEAYLKQVDGLKISSPPMSEEQYGIVVKKGNKELLDQMNAGLGIIRANGEYDRITRKWFE